MTTTVPLISVIVPIFNVEPYLQRCIDSIVVQTYQNLEILLVDDGSPDRCGEICDQAAQKDRRIKVIHKKNGGLSDARNEGMRSATGELFLFVDSDDCIAPTMVATLYHQLAANQADIAICGYEMFDAEGSRFPIKFEMATDPLILSGEEATRRLFANLEPLMVVAWNKLEKRSLWENRSFPVGKQHEDDFTTYQLFYAAKKVVIVGEPLYFYFQRNDSIVGVGFNEKSLHKIEAYQEAYLFFKDKDHALFERACNLVMIMNMRCIREARASDYPGKEKIISTLRSEGRRFYLKNARHIKRGIKYHLRLIKVYFLKGEVS